jgi:hypothetical protein
MEFNERITIVLEIVKSFLTDENKYGSGRCLGVKAHRQWTTYSCCAAVFQMVAHYYGFKVSYLKALVEKDFFVRGLMVFPTAYVDANYGSTGYIHCMRDEKLVEYIQNKDFEHHISADDITNIQKATLQLAGMDEEFAANK